MSSTLMHDVLLYDSDEEFVESLLPFVVEGLDSDEDVWVVSRRRNHELLVAGLDGRAAGVRFVDSVDWYRTPPRTIAGYHRIIDEAQATGVPGLRVVGEVEFGDSEIDQARWTRYEAALNVAFGASPVWILCPYDTRRLPESVVDQALRTHRHLFDGGQRRDTLAFADPTEFAAVLPISTPSRLVGELHDIDGVRQVRQFARRTLDDLGLPGELVSDILLVVNEIATNALVHGQPPVRVRAWADVDAVLFEVADNGTNPVDPLIGFVPPGSRQSDSRGLWISRQVADRLEVTTNASGTVARVAWSGSDRGWIGSRPRQDSNLGHTV